MNRHLTQTKPKQNNQTNKSHKKQQQIPNKQQHINLP